MENHIRSIVQGLKNGSYSREASVSQGVILRILQLLEWPVYDTDVVMPDYPCKKDRIDYALCHPPKKPLVFIKIKIGSIEALRSSHLFENAFQIGVRLIIITNGQRWKFFLSDDQGAINDLLIYDLDFLKCSESQIVEIFQKYLSFDGIRTGRAIHAAQKDHRDILVKRKIDIALSKAWEKLVNEKNDDLLKLIAVEVERLCSHKPNADQISAFLTNMTEMHQSRLGSERHTETQSFKSDIKSKVRKDRSVNQPSSFGFILKGKEFPKKYAIDVLIGVFLELNRSDLTFFERFVSLEKHGNKRRYLARSPEELFPERPDMASKTTHSREISPGWWLDIHEGKINIERMIMLACQVAGIRYGVDLVIDIGL